MPTIALLDSAHRSNGCQFFMTSGWEKELLDQLGSAIDAHRYRSSWQRHQALTRPDSARSIEQKTIYGESNTRSDIRVEYSWSTASLK